MHTRFEWKTGMGMGFICTTHHDGGDIYDRIVLRIYIPTGFADYEAVPQGVWYTPHRRGDNSGDRLEYWNNVTPGWYTAVGCECVSYTRWCVKKQNVANLSPHLTVPSVYI